MLTSSTSDGTLAFFLASSPSLLGTLEYVTHQAHLIMATERGRVVEEEATGDVTELQRLANTIW